MPARHTISLNLFCALALLLGGVASAHAADLQEMFAAQAQEQEQEETAPAQQAPQAEGREGFLNSLSDFLGNAEAPEQATENPNPDAPYGDEWAAEDGFEPAPSPDPYGEPNGDRYGRDEDTHYDGEALAPEASDIFDDAFGADTVRAAHDEGELQGPAADDAPEDFTEEGAVETQPLDAPDGAEEMDIFGRPKDGSKLVKEGAGENDFKFDLSDLPAVDFDVPKNATVTVRALDKITARMSEHQLKVNTPYNFGTLSIVMRTCVKSPPEETPEVKAFLQIADNRPEMDGKAWFSGWMFASSPAISALEHPVYDVWVIDCNIVSASADDESR